MDVAARPKSERKRASQPMRSAAIHVFFTLSVVLPCIQRIPRYKYETGGSIGAAQRECARHTAKRIMCKRIEDIIQAQTVSCSARSNLACLAASVLLSSRVFTYPHHNIQRKRTPRPPQFTCGQIIRADPDLTRGVDARKAF